MNGPLTPSTWMRVSSILDELLDRPESEWPSLVDRRCTTPDMRHHVLRLLAAHRAEASFLAQPAIRLAGSFADDSEIDEQEELPAAPASIGPWTIIREIGRGGMGVVYLAERTGDQFRQLAALKLVRAAGGSEELLARFRRERQILASLNHPNIARLLDGGRAEDGSPYLAMEYVEGRPLTTYCRERGLGVEDRLRLLLRICDAVQHAHARLVVHRDLKPSNILVTDVGEPRLLDFGIAKLLAEDEATAGLTRTGLPLMTPEYAAPEQLRGEPVSTATDVFALGLILYELMVDQHAPKSGVTRPSLAVKDKARRRRLAGDLDTIILMALREEPARRYASAEALARDIERHLDGLPVSARPDTMTYRAHKFARRHRWGVIASATAIVVLLAFAATMAEQARRTARQRDRAERVSQFLVNLFTVSNPLAQGGNVTAREILDRGSQRIESELAADPEIQGHLMHTMGNVYWAIGLLSRAEHLFSRAIEVQQAAFGADDARTLHSMNALGNILVREWRLEAGVRILTSTLERQRVALGPEHDATVGTMNDLAYWLGALGRYTEAEKLHRAALDARRRRFGSNYGVTVWSMTDLGVILMRQGRYQEAERFTSEALDTWVRIKAPGNQDLFNEALLRGNAAAVYQRERRYREAETYFLDAAAVIERVMGAENPHTLTARRDLAAFYAVTGRYDTSEKLQSKTLDASRRVLGPKHTDALQSAYWLAVVYRETGRLDEAVSLQQETLSLQREQLGAEHPDTLLSTVNLARTLARQGRFDEASRLVAGALQTQQQKYGAQHPDSVDSLYASACIAALRDRRTEALDLLRQAVESNYVDPARLLREPDLRGLRGDAEFERLVAKAQQPATR